MTSHGNVVLPVSTVPEAEFLNAMVEGLSRAQSAAGSQKMLARLMDLTPKQVGNIMAGGSTDPKRLWDVHFSLPGARPLDTIADLYGVRIVHKESVCHTDGKLSAVVCALLKKAIDAEMDGDPDHRELLDMEGELREARALIDMRIEAIADLRSSRK